MNLILKIIKIIEKFEFFKRSKINIVFLKKFPSIKIVSNYINKSQFNFNCLYNVTNMAKLYLNADFCICSGGATAFESAFMGRPMIIVCISKNQERLSLELENLGVAKVVYLEKKFSSNFSYHLNELTNRKDMLDEMKYNCHKLSKSIKLKSNSIIPVF